MSLIEEPRPLQVCRKPKALKETGSAALTLAALKAHCPGNRVECWPSIDTLAKLVGLDKRTVQRHLAKLENLGYISRHYRREHASRLYVLKDKALAAYRDDTKAGGEAFFTIARSAAAYFAGEPWCLMLVYAVLETRRRGYLRNNSTLRGRTDCIHVDLGADEFSMSVSQVRRQTGLDKKTVRAALKKLHAMSLAPRMDYCDGSTRYMLEFEFSAAIRRVLAIRSSFAKSATSAVGPKNVRTVRTQDGGGILSPPGGNLVTVGGANSVTHGGNSVTQKGLERTSSLESTLEYTKPRDLGFADKGFLKEEEDQSELSRNPYSKDFSRNRSIPHSGILGERASPGSAEQTAAQRPGVAQSAGISEESVDDLLSESALLARLGLPRVSAAYGTAKAKH